MRHRLLILAAAAALLAAGAVSLAAQEEQASSDPFDTAEFDQAVQQGEAQDAKAALETQFGGNLAMSGSASTTADFDWYTVGGSFSGKAFVKISVPDYGQAYLSYNFSKSISQGAGGALPPGVGAASGDPYAADFALSEFYLGFDVAQAVFFRVGNQLLAWGPSFIWTPVDFVNLQKADPLAAFDQRRGKPGVRATVPLGIANVFLFADMADTVTPTGPGGSLEVNDPLETVNFAGRFDITALGFEFGLTTYLGASIQNTYGLDFSGRLLGFDVYGEGALAFAYDSYDFSYAYSLGFQRSFGDLSYWSVSGEFFSNSAGTDDTSAYPGLIIAGDFVPFYVGKYYAYAALTRTHIGMDGISATLSGFANFSDMSFLARLSTSIRLPRLVPFTFGISWAGGGADREFTYFAGSNALTADLRVSFEF